TASRPRLESSPEPISVGGSRQPQTGGSKGMEESVQGLSRVERLKRGAVGAAAIAGADALVRAGGAGAALTAPKPGGKLVVGIGQVFEDIHVLRSEEGCGGED